MPARALYDLGYRLIRMPWEVGPRDELVQLVTSGRLQPGRAVDLGCGTGANAVYLAQHGFEVTGIDFAPTALTKAKASAAAAGVELELIEADLTDLPDRLPPFDVLVDYGTFDDLSPADRDRYVDQIVPLAKPNAQFLLWCFEWPTRRRDRLTGLRSVQPGEMEKRFGQEFMIERLSGTTPDLRRMLPGFAAYLMTRHGTERPGGYGAVS